MKGTIYKNKNRYWYKVIKPGETKPSYMPLIPIGAKFATSDYGVALNTAKIIWESLTVNKPVDICKTIKDLAERYCDYIKDYYRSSQEGYITSLVIKKFSEKCGAIIPQDYGPLALKEYRDTLITDDLCRNTVNKYIKKIVGMFQWGSEMQISPASTHYALKSLRILRKGFTEARESVSVKSVPKKDFKKSLKVLSPQIADMVQVLTLTVMRPSELLNLRPVEIDMTKKVWKYKPSKHKLVNKDIPRIIAIGPQAQEILKKYLKSNVNQYFFLNKKGRPYTHTAFRRNIARTLDRKGLNHWFPYQLRHSGATNIRDKFGKETTIAVLGHRTSTMVEVYTDINYKKAEKAAAKCG